MCVEVVLTAVLDAPLERRSITKCPLAALALAGSCLTAESALNLSVFLSVTAVLG